MEDCPISQTTSIKDFEKRVDLWKQPYSCPECILSPEILSINKSAGTVKIKYENHKEIEISISKSLSELTKIIIIMPNAWHAKKTIILIRIKSSNIV